MTTLSLAKRALQSVGVDARTARFALLSASLEAALREQRLAGLRDQLRTIVPDISAQYTATSAPTDYERYLERAMRGLHAFQVRCAMDAIAHLGGKNLTVVDVGDSAGTHVQYLRQLTPVRHTVSVNLDPIAVAKIREKGLTALCCRAEELDLGDQPIDLFISFETLEHLSDPLRFLHRLALREPVAPLLMTVPYRRHSRFGGFGLRAAAVDNQSQRLSAETLHILELSMGDWTLLARLAGWVPVFRRVYWQYPRRSMLRLMAPLWRRIDFEGFLALFLQRDLSLASRYEW